MPQNYSSLKNVVGAAWYSTTNTNQTGFLSFPIGTTAQRPASPTQGMTRYNSTLGTLEFYDTTYNAWVSVSKAAADTSFNLDYLVIAGGGGGGGGFNSYAAGGGGGAGGMVTGSAFSVSILVSYAVTVGAGGAGGINSSTPGASIKGQIVYFHL
jgi:hypothetical protein